MLEPAETREFERAMGELQQGLWIVKTEERYEPTFSYRWDLLERWLPDEVAEGRRLRRARRARAPARALPGRRGLLDARRCSRGSSASGRDEVQAPLAALARAGAVARPRSRSRAGRALRGARLMATAPAGFRYIDIHTHLHPPWLWKAIRRWFESRAGWTFRVPDASRSRWPRFLAERAWSGSSSSPTRTSRASRAS